MAAAIAVATTLTSSPALADEDTDAPARRVQLELTGPVFVPLNSSAAPNKTGWWVQLGGAVDITDRLAVEAYGAWGQNVREVNENPVDSVTETDSMWSAMGGVRWYVREKKPKRIAEPYLSVGGGFVSGYISSAVDILDDQGNKTGTRLPTSDTGFAYITPGVKILSGERSGIIVRVPFHLTFKDIDQSFITPAFGFFFAF